MSVLLRGPAIAQAWGATCFSLTAAQRFEAYAADALSALAGKATTRHRGGKRPSVRRQSPELVLRVDLAALLRGSLDTGARSSA